MKNFTDAMIELFCVPLSLCRVLIIAVFINVGFNGASFAQDKPVASQNLPAIAFSGRVVGNAERFRLLLDFDKSVKREVIFLDNPRRMILDFSEVVFSLGEQLRDSPSSLLRSVRFGAISPTRSRMVLLLDGPVDLRSQSFKQVAGSQNYRFIADVIATTPERFAKLAKDGVARIEQLAIRDGNNRSQKAKNSIKKFTVVIDPGHGGIDGGATGRHKSVEKEITLGFSLALKKELSRHPLIDVKMTREDDSFVSLRERLNLARKSKADLNISVHADSLAQKKIRGATIYTLSKEGSDSLSRVLAAKQNRADLVAGLALPEVEDSAKDILIDLTRRETEVFSRRLAELMVQKLAKSVQLINNPHRSADFFVLKAPEVPSVLLELGYLSNDEDEKLMQSESWRLLAAKRIADAVIAFLEPRMAK